MKIHSRVRFDSDQVVLLGLLAASLGLNLFLGVKLNRGPVVATPAEGFKKGDVIPPTKVKSMEGREEVIGFVGSRPSIVYVFSPSCGWCNRNMPALESLESSVGSNYRFIGVAIAQMGAAEFVERHHVRFPTYFLSTANDPFATKVPAVPQTLLVSEKGVVLETWSGAYMGLAKLAIESYFNVTLKPLEEPGKEASHG